MECPKCNYCIISGSPPIEENDSTAVSVVVVQAEEDQDSKVLKVPCIVCFDPCCEEGVADKSKIFKPVTQQEKEEDKLFQWFLLAFRFDFKRGKIRRGPFHEVKSSMDRFDQIINKDSLIGWDGQGGKSLPLPFCRECRNELVRLFEKKNSLKCMGKGKAEQTRILKEGKREFKRKMWGSERKFLESDIYVKDKRYHRVRSKLTNN